MIYEYSKNAVFPNGLVLLYFYASYSSDCLINKQLLQNVSTNTNMVIYKINTTHFYQLKTYYQVTRIPAYILLSDKQEIKRIQGNTSLTYITKWLEEVQ